MKKLHLLMAILFFAVSSTLAQDTTHVQTATNPAPPPYQPPPGAGITIKPTVGINFTNVSKQPNGSAQAQVGWKLVGR
jgi:hypothetical protein